MELRKLKSEDAALMLEWMHDPDCVKNLQGDFGSKTLQDCEKFIEAAKTDKFNLHMAIVDETDTYMGTVSLKHIDREKGNAEFAICVRSCAMGKGYSRKGMRRIIDMGLLEMGLQEVYWCVSPANERAIRFYDKNGYQRINASQVTSEVYTSEQIQNYLWYAERRKVNEKNSNEVPR